MTMTSAPAISQTLLASATRIGVPRCLIPSRVMSDAEPAGQVTQLLQDWRNGRKEALDALTPIVYAELRKMAGSYLASESKAATLQPTALVNEAYIRLAGQNLTDFQSRAHFFGVASRLMRQILVDHARKQLTNKRGARAAKVSLEDNVSFAVERSAGMVALDDALTALAAFDERKSRIIELRYFGGFSIEETAQAMEISISTITRELRLAEAWLHKELTPAAP